MSCSPRNRSRLVPVSLVSLALCLGAACSDDDFSSLDGPGGMTDLALDSKAPADQHPGLPDGYGPLYSCKEPGKACNAHDPCAVNPICGWDYKCYPASVMNCNDNLPCTTDTCAGLGVCTNIPKAGTCKLALRVPKGTTCAQATGGAKVDAGVPASDAGAGAEMETIFCCFKAGDRSPTDGCMQCNPPGSGDAGGTGGSATKWSPATGGTCDDLDPCTQNDYCQNGVCKGTSYLSKCADAYPCTEDKCDGKGGCLGNPLKTGWCLINQTCYKDGTPNPDGSCTACVSATNPAAWTPVSNTCQIDGKCYPKGSKNPGGCAECDPAVSATAWTVTGTTHCLINKVCVAKDAKDSTGCASCQPSVNKYAYSPLPGVCKIGGKCYQKGAKHSGGCAECAPATSATSWTVTGTLYCLIQDKCYNSGAADSTGCASCQPSSNKYAWTPKTGLCQIDGKCYANGAKHPGGCGECDTSKSSTQWTVTKPNTCLISDKCYNAGDKLGCFQCDPKTSTTSWTQIAGCVSMNLDVGTHSKIYSSSMTRGFWFKAPVNFTIIEVRVPPETGNTLVQNVQIVKFPSQPPQWSTKTKVHTTLLYKKNWPASTWIPANIAIKKDEYIGIIGARGTSSLKNSYRASGDYTTKISNIPVVLTRMVYQSNLYTSQAGELSSEKGGAIGRIEVKYKP